MNLLMIAAAAAAAPSAAATPPPPVVTIPVTGDQMVSAEDIAAYISPRDVAAYMPAPPPTTELVAISDSFFSWLENITVVALFIVGFFLLARLLHAWMLHRSIRRALEAKSDSVGPLIEKLNKPYEHVGGSREAEVPGEIAPPSRPSCCGTKGDCGRSLRAPRDATPTIWRRKRSSARGNAPTI